MLRTIKMEHLAEVAIQAENKKKDAAARLQRKLENELKAEVVQKG